MKRTAIACVSLGLLALLFASAFAQGPARQPAPEYKTIADAYIYLLGRVLVIRQENMDRGATGFAYNTIKYNPIGEADWVNPNLDTAYIEAWFAVDHDTPIIFEVPEIKGPYYTAQILDEWGEVIANINERMFPSKPFGKFALVYPNSDVKIPVDAARIDLHSGKAKLLGHVEIKGDKDEALKLQHGFKTADAIAMKLGIENTATIRVRAGISYALTEAMDEGHCGLPTEELIPLAEKLLEVPQQLISTALETVSCRWTF